MTTRTIPKTYDARFNLGHRALAGIITNATDVPITLNTAPKFADTLNAYFGEPSPGPGGTAGAGLQGALNLARTAVTDALAARRLAIADARKFCGDAIDALKIQFGRRWNPSWAAVGLTENLTVPKLPHALVPHLRGYLRSHPAHERPDANITAARADALAIALQVADHNLDVARRERTTAKKDCDDLFERLGALLTGLRQELDQLLEDDDERWFDFGFSRPIDPRTPPMVDSLTLRLGAAAGELLAEWTPAPNAANYRVSYALESDVDGFVEVGLFADPRAIIRGLPPGARVTVRVTSRNAGRESLPREAVITLV